MQAIGKGEAAPIADNKTEAGKAQNRRIGGNIEFTDPEPDVDLQLIASSKPGDKVVIETWY